MFKINHQKYLKVKVKSLAEESRIIRLEEKRSFGPQREGLYHHRLFVVRIESRAAQLAYAYLRGQTLDQVEAPTTQDHYYRQKAIARAQKIVQKYGTVEAAEGFNTWVTTARSSNGTAPSIQAGS